MNIINIEFEPQAVIIANGEFPYRQPPVHKLIASPYIVCSDGAANSYLDSGLIPDAIVGDNDSIREEYQKLYASIIHVDKSKESNDLTKSVLFLKNKGIEKIAIVGASGKREDYTIGNIFLLTKYLKMGLNIRMYTDHGVFIPCKDECHFIFPRKSQISIFRIDAQGLSCKGLKEPIYDFQNLWEGISNENTEELFSIFGTGYYIVFITYLQ